MVLVLFLGWAALAFNNGEEPHRISKSDALKAAKNFLKKYYGFEDKSISISFDYDIPMENHYYPDEICWEMVGDAVKGDEKYNFLICVDIFTEKVVCIVIDNVRPWEERETTNKISFDDTRPIAENFLKEQVPDKFKETIFMNEYYTTNGGGFRFRRFVNGVLYDRNSLEVSVDVLNSMVRFYGDEWEEDIVFPKAEAVISEDEAIKLMEDGIKLFYKEGLVYYGFDEDYRLIDAGMDFKTILEERANRLKDITTVQKEEILKIAQNAGNIKKIIDEKMALEAIEKHLKALYNMDFEITGIESSNPNYNKKIWSASFKSMNRDNEINGEISINAFNGELRRLERNYIDPNLKVHIDEDGFIDEEVADKLDITTFKPTLTWAEGYDRVIELISRTCPDKIGNIETKIQYNELDNLEFKSWLSSVSGHENMKVNMLGGCYSYYFPRMENGMLIEDYEGIELEIDGKGEVIEFRCRWDYDLEIPKLDMDTIISREEAKKKFFEKYKPLLLYEKVDNQLKEKDSELKLFYGFSYMVSKAIEAKIDPLTGEFK